MSTIQITDEQFEIILDALALYSMKAKYPSWGKFAHATYDAILEQSPVTAEGHNR
jgi:hypothetical protein